MKRSFLAVCFFALSLAAPAAAATCPFNVPVVTLPPHTVSGYSWGNVIRPMNDPCIGEIEVDPTNPLAWYAGGPNGLYMTKNGGATWTKPITGNLQVLFLVAEQPQLVYAGVGNKLYLTRDWGSTWTVIRTFPKSVSSVLVSGGLLYVGLAWDNHVDPSGIWIGNLGAGVMSFKPFGAGQTGLIVWTIARDPLSGAIYAGTEIFDHTQPYHPPFFRSLTNGATWDDITGTLPWHVIDSAVRPSDGYLYALTEGLGTYGTLNQGASWIPPMYSPGLGCGLTMDPNTPTRLYLGRQKFGTSTGGLFRSVNAGAHSWPIGLDGVTVCDSALNGTVTRIYAAAYGSGIYVASIP